MLRKQSTSAEVRARTVLDVLAGRRTVAEAAAHLGVTRQTVYNWQATFVTSGSASLAARRDDLDAASPDRAATHVESAVVAIVDRLRHLSRSDELDIETLEAVRTGAGLPVIRFCELTGIARRTYYARRADVPRVSNRDRLDDAIAAARARHPEWGARRIWRHVIEVDGVDVSLATVKRTLAHRGAAEVTRMSS